MDETNNNELDKYLENLPESVASLVQDKTWPKRVDEIASKYSLTDEQKSALQDIVLTMLVGMEDPETFEKLILTELSISQILAGQIFKDLDTRVFQYAFDFVSGNKKGDIPLPKWTGDMDVLDKQSKQEIDNSKDLEIPPVILPMKETTEEREKIMAEIPTNLPGVEILTSNNQTKDLTNSSEQSQPKRETFVGKDFVQQPISVPRFNVASYPEQPATQPKPQNLAEKLEIQNPPRYTMDPYREPIE
jgi:hypothetical protein